MDTISESTFLEFIHYSNWANQQILRSCQGLSPDELETAIPGAYGTIRSTLEHIIRGETYYLKLLTGSSPRAPFDWKAGPGLAEITEYANQVGAALVEMAQRVPPTALVVDKGEDGSQHHYRAVAVFIQIINHGVEHRTNITTILNQGLQKPPDVDGWGYLEAHQDRFYTD